MGFRYRDERRCIHNGNLSNQTIEILLKLLQDGIESMCYCCMEKTINDRLKSDVFDLFERESIYVSEYFIDSFLKYYKLMNELMLFMDQNCECSNIEYCACKVVVDYFNK
jgi:hypothetical protein